MNEFWKSRKFWLSVVGVGLVILRQVAPNFPLSDAEISNLVLLIVSLIIGTGLNDVAAARVSERQASITPSGDKSRRS